MVNRIFMVAGEASADLHGAHLLHELKKKYKGIDCFGAGGKKLATEGMEVVVKAQDLSVVGLSEWWGQGRRILRAYSDLKKAVREKKPQLAILMDLPDFNLLLAGYLKRKKIPVVYYISPQVWAWRRYRVRKIRRLVDKMLVIFPFEEKFYKSYGIDARFVGHPLVKVTSQIKERRSQKAISEAPVIGILPGSRSTEIRYHAKTLRETLGLLKKKYPKAMFHLPVADTLVKSEVEKNFAGLKIRFHAGHARDVLQKCDVAVVASGTATLETALTETPFVLFYKVGKFSAWVFKHVIRYDKPIGMPNLLLSKKLVPELFQENFSPERLAKEVTKLIESKELRDRQIEGFRKCRVLLGENIPEDKTASEVASLLESLGTLNG